MPSHLDRKSTRLNSSHTLISYAVFCLKKKNKTKLEALEHNQERAGGRETAGAPREHRAVPCDLFCVWTVLFRFLLFFFFFFFKGPGPPEVLPLSPKRPFPD